MPSSWMQSLRPASFRGVKFFVETETAKGGRRVKLHVFPHGETGFNEDLGKKTKKYSFTAYLADETADKQALVLERAFDAPGSATLVLPLFGRKKANCLSFSLKRDKKKHGFIGVNVTFAQDEGFGILEPLGYLVRLIDSFSLKLGAVAGLFAKNFNTIGVAEFVQQAAETQLEDVSKLMLSGLEQIVTPPNSGQIIALIGSLKNPQLLVSGARNNIFSLDSFVAQSQEVPSDLPQKISQILELMTDNLPEADLRDFLTPLLVYAPSAVSETTKNRVQQNKNQAALAAVVRQTALVYYARAVANISYHDRPSAITARADVAEYFGFELAAVSAYRADGHEVYVLLNDLRGQTVTMLGRAIADLAPVVFIEAPQVMPSLYWAARIYNDANRATELVQRNNIIHAGFMPTNFEALSR